jgi:hypothetical protein
MLAVSSSYGDLIENFDIPFAIATPKFPPIICIFIMFVVFLHDRLQITSNCFGKC